MKLTADFFKYCIHFTDDFDRYCRDKSQYTFLYKKHDYIRRKIEKS